MVHKLEAQSCMTVNCSYYKALEGQSNERKKFCCFFLNVVMYQYTAGQQIFSLSFYSCLGKTQPSHVYLSLFSFTHLFLIITNCLLELLSSELPGMYYLECTEWTRT